MIPPDLPEGPKLQVLEAILDSTAAIVYLMDSESRFLYINRRWQKVFGLTHERLVGRPVDEFFPKSTAEQFRKNNREVLASGKALELEEVVPQEDGLHTYLTVKVPIVDPSGRPYAVCGISTDITGRKRTEQALKDANRKKDEFLAILAHELRNPLAPLRNGLDLLHAMGGDEATRERTLAMMGRQVSQMVRLIDDLLDVSRITSGRLELRKEWIDLTRVVETALETSRPLIEASDHRLTVELPPATVLVHADRTRLAQVIANLLTNAAKYTDPGGALRLGVTPQDGEVVVTVQDSGVGIPKEMLGPVFEMFTQVNRALERSQGGLGIGLTLAKRLIEMHGGRIEAESEGEGMGSTFTLRLPAAPAVAPSERVLETIPRETVPNRRILVADDNEDSAASLALLLRLRGHEVRTAGDGMEAVALAESFRPDLLILDIGMPRLNGYDAARRIRQQPWSRGAVLIALTGWGQEEDRLQAKESGFDYHLVKPMDLSFLEQLMVVSRTAEP
jgi:PAS domain S-box-containing protein